MPGPYDESSDQFTAASGSVTPESGRLPLPPDLSPRRPVRGRRSGRRRSARWLSWTAVGLSLLILVLSGGAYGYYVKLNGNIHRISVFSHLTDRPAKATDGAENIVIVGDDSRVGATPAELAILNTTSDGGSDNTDTIIILHIAPDGAVEMISIPRDSYVPIPGFGTFKINSAYADGESEKPPNGPGLLVETLENLTGLHIDHFISVSFVQFVAISNAIGGVQVCISTPGGAHDSYSGVDLPQGVSTIQGSQALAFVRQRHGLANGDLDRIQRQQRFVSAIVRKAKSIRNPATINALLEKVTQSITVDSGLSGVALLKLADRLKGLNPDQIQFYTVPVANADASTHLANGQLVDYVQLDLTKLKQFFANVSAERNPNYVPPSPTATVTALPADEVHVNVLNGSGVNGRAAATKASLSTYGFQVGTIGTTTVGTTVIDYNPADAGAAVELAKAVPGASLVPDAALTAGTVQLTVGTNFTSITNPAAVATTSAPATPTTTAPSSATPTAADDDCGP